jgi:hypothetical protein
MCTKVVVALGAKVHGEEELRCVLAGLGCGEGLVLLGLGVLKESLGAVQP